MLNPGNRSWGEISIPAAATYVHDTIHDLLAGAKSVTFYVDFTYGSGGTSVKLYFQTSFDGGTTWIDVACVAFTTSSAKKIATLTAAILNTAAGSDAALSDNTVVAGAVIDRLRLKYVVTGTYSASSMKVRANVA